MKGISVIICCHNSVERIGATLLHLQQQYTTMLLWEVILVDNNCTDNTIDEALKVWSNHHVKIRVVEEQTAGQIYARGAGIRAALYDYLVFCDDDNWLDGAYIQRVYELFEKNPQAGAIGGQSTLAVGDGVIIPNWFKTEENTYAVGKQALKSSDVTDRLYLWGAGLAVRKTIVEKCFDKKYPFLLTGRKGKNITSGDDCEICNRIVLMGYRLLYDERLEYIHFIPAGRLKDDYLIEVKKGFELSFGVLTLYSEFINTIILNKGSKSQLLQNVLSQRPLNTRKLLRILYWLYGLPIYVNNDMRLIRAFYKKNISF